MPSNCVCNVRWYPSDGSELREQAAANEIDLTGRTADARFGRGDLLAAALGHLQGIVERESSHRDGTGRWLRRRRRLRGSCHRQQRQRGTRGSAAAKGKATTYP